MLGRLISSFLAFLLSFNIFPINPAQNATHNEAGGETTLLFAGDVMLGRSVMGQTIDSGNYFYPFEKVAGYTRDADITFVNLENPIIENCPRTDSGFKFCTTPEIAKGLKDAGVDIVTLANNHSGNYGETGLAETKKYLDEMEIKWVDGTNLVVLEKNGIKFGFLGFNYIYRNLTQSDLDLVKESDSKVNVLIVSPHWGDEYHANANNFQKETAAKFIENEADIIIGHHPHWVQNYEEVDGKPVYYSLGNFVFDQPWSEETKKGELIKFSFDPPGGEASGSEIVKKEEFRTYIRKVGQPEIVR